MECVKAVAYEALSQEQGLKPTEEYIAFLVEGAREHGFTPEYIKKLELVECQEAE